MSQSSSVPNLQVMTRCPMCDTVYKKDKIKVINKKDGVVSLYLNCGHCKSSVAMLLILGPAGFTSISVPTDITEDDFEKMVSGTAVDYDDVLEMYDFLKSV